jgi:phasin family protein
MFEQFNTKQMFVNSKQMADIAFKAHGLAVASFERALELHFKTIENRVAAAVEFATEATEVRDLEGVRTLTTKSVALAKDSAEKFYATSQELIGMSVKTNEQIGELVRGSFEAANETFVKPTAKKSK